MVNAMATTIETTIETTTSP